MLYVTIPVLPLFLIAAGGAGALGISVALMIFRIQERGLGG